MTLVFGILGAIVIIVVSWLSTRVSDASYGTNEGVRTSREPTNTGSRLRTDGLEHTATENIPSQNDSQASEQLRDVQNPTATESMSDMNGVHQSNLRHRHTPSSRPASTGESTSPNVQSANGNDSTPEGPTSSVTLIKIRLKYMDESSVTVEAHADEMLSTFRSRCLPQENQNRYRLIYRGQVLRDGSKTLRQFNLVINQNGDSEAIPVIHCFLSPVTNTQENVANSATEQIQMMAEDLHIGSLFLPILGLCLVCLWYLCIFHTSLFSIQSVVSIVGFTFLYVILIINQFL